MNQSSTQNSTILIMPYYQSFTVDDLNSNTIKRGPPSPTYSLCVIERYIFVEKRKTPHEKQ